nr:hypothetical protein [uncultured Cellulosilyticum sp.]
MNLYKDKLLIVTYTAYIEFVARTSSIKLQGDILPKDFDSSMIGFWHGDSFTMNLLLRELRHYNHNISVVVTQDKRGDYIHGVLTTYHTKTLRIPDGAAIRPFLATLKETSQLGNETICIALDGPLGPYKETKKLLFMLSEHAKKPCILLNVNYSKAIKLSKRWDYYTIVLPFSKITFTAHHLGITQQEDLKQFKLYKQFIHSKSQCS